ncbi:hypothetical protein ABEB36_013407 [Hypothenemus hampei]|uniref:BZIP domain-containing protein n=1 Tax=Hypothenemus hampei TaxID=57062 RepID=A0ABD1E7Y3_HYPHA
MAKDTQSSLAIHYFEEQQQGPIPMYPIKDLDDYLDMETMQFVNPYEVINTTSQQANSRVEYMIAKEGPQKLKMEEFGDIAAYLSNSYPNLIDYTDELIKSNNIDNDTLLMDLPLIPAASSMETNLNDSKIKVEHYPTNTNILSLDRYYHSGPNTKIEAVGHIDNDMLLYQQQSAHDKKTSYNSNFDVFEDFYNNNNNNNNVNLSLNNIKKANSTCPSPQEDDSYSCASSPNDLAAVPDRDRANKMTLNLMGERFKFPLKEEGISSLNTPDVIEGVVEMGNDFNILDLVNHEDITVLSADDELLSVLTSPTVSSTEQPSLASDLTTKKSTRKCKRSYDDDDDDEDYVPPLPKRQPLSTIRSGDLDVESSNSSEDSYYFSNHQRKKVNSKRGRPPKRTDSVSSDGVTKYRELRDKNNEASRKSRLKRKIKEQEYEKEADELQMKNIRLKAQVEELEKMVTSFRNNLFKIIATK